MPDESFIDNFRSQLANLGEEEVRMKFSANEWSAETQPTKRSLAADWLKSKDDERVASAEAKRNAREEQTLALAEDANNIARFATRWAMWAAIIATIAIIIAAKDQILALIL